MNHYQTLGVSPNATPDEIKKAFREKAKQYHPDVTGGNAKKFMEVKEAYEALMNPQQYTEASDGSDPFQSYWGMHRKRTEQQERRKNKEYDPFDDFFKRAHQYNNNGGFYTWGTGGTQKQPPKKSPSERQIESILLEDIKKRKPVFSQYGFTCDLCAKVYKGGNMIYYFALEKKVCRDCKTAVITYLEDL
jgi:curved DNA-binding protein CbpA